MQVCGGSQEKDAGRSETYCRGHDLSPWLQKRSGRTDHDHQEDPDASLSRSIASLFRRMGFAPHNAAYKFLRIIIAKIASSSAAPARAPKQRSRKASGINAVCVGNESFDTARKPTKSPRRLASTRTPAGHSGWRSESGARGQGLVTSAPGRLRENARPALRPACDWIAGLGQAGAANDRSSAKSQEARLELSGGVGSLPQEPRWNAGRRSAPRWARAASRRVRIGGVASAGVPPALFLFVRRVG